ncbi:hypothetical protein Z951_13260 [Streptomyces sp. PRh5]|uniref:hypothetical protein n=1 Tax=Streptomyces sp. PRh5 TaxID=1158056 RepID=UPI00044C1433|nr:hypothetical protein [Streptomyces sp. PRh5]EXU67687.1 hypothetical protein Z951_13260 [Streptomyces sp. PRh5]
MLAERAVLGFRTLRPRFCSLYERPFWRHERYWKVPSVLYLALFNGTPFKPAIWRLLGVRMGHRVFDDGCRILERTLTQVGDDCALNADSILQAHEHVPAHTQWRGNPAVALTTDAACRGKP